MEFWASGPTYKVGLFLSLAGEPFDYVHVNLREGEHKRPEYLAKQRFGQVPLLVDNSNGRHLCQSAAIVEYLADKTGKFGGATLQERMDAREWVFWEFDRLSKGIYRPRAAKLGFAQFPAEIVAHYEADGQAGLKTLESHLGGRSWIVGDAPSFADIDVYGVVAYAPQAGVDLSAFPNVSAWMKRDRGAAGLQEQRGPAAEGNQGGGLIVGRHADETGGPGPPVLVSRMRSSRPQGRVFSSSWPERWPASLSLRSAWSRAWRACGSLRTASFSRAASWALMLLKAAPP